MAPTMEILAPSLDLQFAVFVIIVCVAGLSSLLHMGHLSKWTGHHRRGSKRKIDHKETHVVLMSDDNDMPGLFACVNSIIRNSRTPGALRFHIAISSTHIDLYTSRLMQHFSNGVGSFEVVNLRSQPAMAQWFNRLVDAMPKNKKRYTINMVNYARFFVVELFPSLLDSPDNLFAYVDSDMLVYGDLHELCSELQSTRTDSSPRLFVGSNSPYKTAFGAVGNTGKKGMLRFAFWCFLNRINPWALTPYNAGFYVSSPEPWANSGDEVEALIRAGMKEVVLFDTQPLMIILFRNIVRSMKWTWNTTGYGWRTDIEINRQTMKSIHWNGTSKGWHPDNKYHSSWTEYQVPIFPSASHGGEVA